MSQDEEGRGRTCAALFSYLVLVFVKEQTKLFDWIEK